MDQIYIAMETLAAIVTLILIYANIFESKQSSNKRKLFSHLLIATEVVVVADLITCLDLDWKRLTLFLQVLLVLTYVVPSVLQVFFSMYIYEHISLKVSVSRKPFYFMAWFAVVEGILTLVLCVSGELYSIVDGAFQSGPLETLYYIMNLVAVLFFMAIIIANGRKIGTHDMLAALSFCVVPYLSVAMTLATGLNVTVTLLSVSMLFMYVMLQAENESFLYGRANLDELTGLYNRAAYEDEIEKYESNSHHPDFVYASIDVNGLKQVNDNLGHAAGDELLCGAATCLNNVLGKYGKVFRTGGDEFVSIFHADESRLAAIMESLEAETLRWKGKQVDSLAISVGYVTVREFPDKTVLEVAKLADQRMYEAKRQYYAAKGVDRRGQNDAHKVLCALYTKILKINLTEDTFSIINMKEEEQKKEFGFTEKLSEWLTDFGRSGQVHPDDLEAYLSKVQLPYMREYFQSGKTSLTVLYRRRYGSEFKQVMMEIIPTGEYREDDQSLYLYVKNIDI